jgi:signal transduction histidine kinase
MTIRTKAWLSVALSVAVTFGVAFWALTAAMRRELTRQAQAAANDVADDIKRALENLAAGVDDKELALVLHQYAFGRHQQLQKVQLVVEPEATRQSIRIEALRGEVPEINYLNYRLPDRYREHVFTSSAEGDSFGVVRPVDLQGPWKGTLSIQWSLGRVEQTLQITQRWTLVFGAAHLIALFFVAGLLIDRVVVRRLDRLGRAMRDVESGDLERRVPVDGRDEVGHLSQGFNRMLEQLSSADKEIRAFNDRLAKEIEAATMDLSRKNVALAQMNRLLNELRRENASKVRLATLGQLAAQLAHEIGTPLSSVSGHLQLAQLQKDLPPGLRDRLEVANREIARIGRIVRDYLDSTRSLEPDKKETSLGRVLGEAVEITRGVEPGGRRAIDVLIDDEPVGFVTDPGLLRQIVINLLSNALDAVERGGQVALRARSEGEDVLVTVSDTGTGIPPDDLRRIFEPFYTTKGRGKGTGLGLAICRELVAALGGTISVESEAGKGSTFTIRLPRRSPAPAAEARPLAAAGGAA